MAHWAKIQPAVKELCARENGASLKEISVGIDRPFNVCSKFLSNLMEAQEIVKVGVHGKFRYFTDTVKAAQHDKEAKAQRAKQKEEAHERKKAQQAERERRKRAERREAKGLGPYVKPEPKPKIKKAKPEKQGREVYVRANDRYTQIKTCMLFHKPKDWANLKSMAKRASRFSRPSQINKDHRLAAAWSNCVMMLEADKTGEPLKHDGPYDEIDSVDQYVLDLHILDWFATKVDHYAKTNMLEGDETFAEICRQWLTYMPIDVTKLTASK